MVRIKPFRAVIINPKLENRDRLVCPVYDTIDEKNYDKYAEEKNNVIHITTRKIGIDERDFIEYARKNLFRLFSEEILVEREKPSFYIYGIRYHLSEEMLQQIPKEKRRGTYVLFGLVALIEVGEGIVGHEETFERNTRERYNLMKECRMNFSPIVGEYNMPGHELNNLLEDYLGFKRPDLAFHKPPLVYVRFEGMEHILWEISDEKMMEKIENLLKNKNILILDGHHRYAASVLLKEREGMEYTLMMLVEGGDRALLLLPWQRCIKCNLEELWKRIEEKFIVECWDKNDLGTLLSKLNEDREEIRIGMYDGNELYLLRAKGKGERVEDVLTLHELIDSEEISFVSLPKEAIERVDEGKYDAAFVTASLKMEDVEYMAKKGRNLPQKSTRFLPKVLEGIVMRKIR
ncbi:MAG: DUF1015 family protein [Candidatus Syntropharchaeia archaeon]